MVKNIVLSTLVVCYTTWGFSKPCDPSDIKAKAVNDETVNDINTMAKASKLIEFESMFTNNAVDEEDICDFYEDNKEILPKEISFSLIDGLFAEPVSQSEKVLLIAHDCLPISKETRTQINKELLRIMKTTKDIHFRKNIIRTIGLGNIKSSETYEALRFALTAPKIQINNREFAAKYLGKLKVDPTHIDIKQLNARALAHALAIQKNSKDSAEDIKIKTRIRFTAAQSLGQVGFKDDVIAKALKNALKDSDADVIRAIKASLLILNPN